MELTILLTLAVLIAMVTLIVLVGRTSTRTRRPAPPPEGNVSVRPGVEKYRNYRANP